ncbi:hypothetical protein KR044_009216 [Drosophila immigrans]|nr:hypothetical protein KR044_009216 [Drosophila immigrans]
MASCDVQANPSNDKLDNITECPKQAPSTTTTNKSITKSETPTETANVNVNVNVNVNCKVEASSAKSSSNLQPTKIPAPIHVANGFNNRRYTTLMKSLDSKKLLNDSFSSTSTLVNTMEDSGVHMDCSTAEDDISNSCLRPSSSTHMHGNSTETLAASDSFLELEPAEQQTLLVLQRAVAEMEADLAMHSAKLEEEIKLGGDQQMHPAVEPQQQLECDENLEPNKSSIRAVESFPMGSAVQERKHVRVEQLLEAEHDLEKLHKLLHTDMPQTGEDPAPGSELIAARDVDETEQRTRKQMGLAYSLLHILCGKSIRKLSYPILFCGMAVGLIFYFRKD